MHEIELIRDKDSEKLFSSLFFICWFSSMRFHLDRASCCSHYNFLSQYRSLLSFSIAADQISAPGALTNVAIPGDLHQSTHQPKENTSKIYDI